MADRFGAKLVGLLGLIGVWVFLPHDSDNESRPFDFIGFTALATAMAALQLLLDRGTGQDWFNSTEIWVEAVLTLIGLWVFVTHTMTARSPFFNPALAGNVNFLTATALSFMVGLLLSATLALAPTMLQGLMGYTAMQSGEVTVPRGLATFASMIFLSRLPPTVDMRIPLGFGFGLSWVSLALMAGYDLSMDPMTVMIPQAIQGFAFGIIILPLTLLAFSTVPAAIRPEAAAMFSLIRNMGSSAGVAVTQALLVRNTQTMHASLAERVIPSDAVMRDALPGLLDPSGGAGLMMLNEEVTRQAAMVAYVNDYRFMAWISIGCLCALPLMRRPKAKSTDEPN